MTTQIERNLIGWLTQHLEPINLKMDKPGLHRTDGENNSVLWDLVAVVDGYSWDLVGSWDSVGSPISLFKALHSNWQSTKAL